MKLKRKLAAIFSLLTFIILLLDGSVSAVVTAGVSTVVSQTKAAPLNQDFINYIKIPHTFQTIDGHGLGLMPETLDLNTLGNIVGNATVISSLFPSKYDLRTYGGKNFVTPVHDQSSSGTCWAFGTYGSMESCILKASGGTEKMDFSENNIKNRLSQSYTDGFDRGANDGTTFRAAVAYLARWGASYAAGTVLESQDPFSPTSTTSPVFTPGKHVQNVLFLPGRPNVNDATYIPFVKSELMYDGAVAAGFNWSGGSYNTSKYAYYNPYSTGEGHVITIVGWDDTFATSNFVAGHQPAKPGAWICKNSWGSGWGDNGYFYMSYYDTSLSKFIVVIKPEATDNYTKCYQYDPLGWVSAVGQNGGTNHIAWGANIFTGVAGQSLKAVSFYTPVPKSKYVVTVYTGVTAGKPTSGTEKITYQSGTSTYAGYHTIKLDTPVPLTSGKFSVVVKLDTPGCFTPIAVENAVNKYSSKATASAGQSFISYNGTSWTDTTTFDASENVCIKAFSK